MPNLLSVVNQHYSQSTQLNKLSLKPTVTPDKVFEELLTTLEPPQTLLETLLLLHVATGARIKELLNITQGDITTSGYILIRGVKSSRSRLFYHRACVNIMQRSNSHINDLVFPYSYHQAYRLYKKHIGCLPVKTNTRRFMQTHQVRYLFLNFIKTLCSNDSKIIQDIIGHNSIKSQTHYFKEANHG